MNTGIFKAYVMNAPISRFRRRHKLDSAFWLAQGPGLPEPIRRLNCQSTNFTLAIQTEPSDHYMAFVFRIHVPNDSSSGFNPVWFLLCFYSVYHLFKHTGPTLQVSTVGHGRYWRCWTRCTGHIVKWDLFYPVNSFCGIGRSCGG